MEERILVTGGNGHLGSVICRQLTARGRNVRATVRNSSDPNRISVLRQIGVEIVEASLEDSDSITRAVQGCTAIIHTAAPNLTTATNPQKQIIDPMIKGAVNIVNAAKRQGISRIVYTSTCATIGLIAPLGRSLDENDRVERFFSPYLVGKMASEEKMSDQAKAYEIEVVFLHPTAVIGPFFTRLNPGLELYAAFLRGKLPAMPNGGYHLVDVRDVARAHIQAIELKHPPGRYILAGDWVDARRMIELFGELEPSLPLPKFILPNFLLPMIAGADYCFSLITKQPRRITLDLVRDYARIDQRVSSTKARNEFSLEFREVRVTLRNCLAWMKVYLQEGIKGVTTIDPGIFGGYF